MNKQGKSGIKNKKKTLLSLALVIGIILIAVTAFADSFTPGAYEQLKSSIKYTSRQLTKEGKGYTLKLTVKVKDNGKELLSLIQIQKFDQIDSKNFKQESQDFYQSGDILIEDGYSYRDKDLYIDYNPREDVYYLTKFMQNSFDYTYEPDEDPFDSEYAQDVERIFDAFVGNLKSYVFVTKKDKGHKEFTGSLSQAQIPALVNALASFTSKQFFDDQNRYGSSFYNYNDPMVSDKSYRDDFGGKDLFNDGPGTSSKGEEALIPFIKSDIFIKEINGKMLTDKDGLVQEIYAGGVLSGLDDKGVGHDLSLEISLELTDVGTTVLSPPDLSGKTVELREESSKYDYEIISTDMIGTYKSDIILETQDGLVKAGERYLYLDEIGQHLVKGHYEEIVFPEYEEKFKSPIPNFSFESKDFSKYSVYFDSIDTGDNTLEGNLYIDYSNYNISLYVNGIDYYEESGHIYFYRVFD